MDLRYEALCLAYSYPPLPGHITPARERFGEIAYSLYKEADGTLRAHDLDLLAKQLVIFAERGLRNVRREPPREVPGEVVEDSIRGPYDARYLDCEGPREAGVDETFVVTVTLRNESWRPWSSTVKSGPDYLSYHWLDHRGSTTHHEEMRTSLPRVVKPDDVVEAAVHVRTPELKGRYTLAIDMVRESVTWYSDAGCPYLRISFRVR